MRLFQKTAQLADLSIAQLWPTTAGWRAILGEDVYEATLDLARWRVVAHEAVDPGVGRDGGMFGLHAYSDLQSVVWPG